MEMELERVELVVLVVMGEMFIFLTLLPEHLQLI